MRIAIFYNLPSGGAKRALYEWTRRLSASHEIEVFSLSSADHETFDIRPFVQAHHVLQFSPHRLFRSPFGRLNQLQRWRDLGELERLGRSIAEAINQGEYDVVFAHPCRYTFIPFIMTFLRIASVYYLHEPFGPTFKRHFARPYMKENRWRTASRRFDPFFLLYQRRLEDLRRQNVRQTTRLLANSEFTSHQIKMAYDAEAPVCYYGVNTDDFYPMVAVEKENCVISVGELTPRKGFDFVVKSLGALPREKRPLLKLVCNWENPSETLYIRELAAHRDVEVQVLKNLETGQLRREYNSAQLCVYAPVKEPLGLVPLESMACGVPVVGVREGGVCETVKHGKTGLLTERDPGQFGRAIQELLDDPARRVQYGNQGKSYVEKEWRWDHSVQEVERHLASVAQ